MSPEVCNLNFLSARSSPWSARFVAVSSPPALDQSAAIKDVIATAAKQLAFGSGAVELEALRTEREALGSDVDSDLESDLSSREAKAKAKM